MLGIGRDKIAEQLRKKYNILVRKYFYPLLSDFQCYCTQYDSRNTPIAKKISSQVLTLPLFVELEHEQIDYICDAILEIIQAGSRIK